MSRLANEACAKSALFGRRPQARGAAVVSALLIVALIAATAAVLLTDMDNWIEEVTVDRDKAQAGELARDAIDYARLLLAADAAAGSIDALSEDWARQLPPLRHEEALISARISDLQGHFNLNNLRRADGLVDRQALAAYRRLLAFVGLPDQLADNLADWLAASDSRRDGARVPAGSGRPLVSLGELRRVAGYDAAVVARLQTHVGVLDGIQPVNVNTATPAVLAALQPGLGLAAAKALAAGREALPFRDGADFRNRLGDPGLPASLLPIGAASRHFLIAIEVDRGRARARVESLVRRNSNGTPPRILWLTQQ